MATFLDLAGLQYFSMFFVFLFVWIGVFALLSFTRVLGGNKAIDALIGLIFGILVLLSPVVTGAIAFIAPWFGLVFVFILFMVMSFKVFGANSELSASSPLGHVLIVVIVVIMIVGVFSYIRGQVTVPGDNETSGPSYKSASYVVFHPKVLGLILVLLISVFTIALLAGRTS